MKKITKQEKHALFLWSNEFSWIQIGSKLKLSPKQLKKIKNKFKLEEPFTVKFYKMTNFEKWRAYMEGCISPDNYIAWGYYNIISSTLQRRVWVGPKHAPLYPNMYTILVGEPGVGKGRVITPVSEILKYHKLENPKLNNATNLPGLNETDKLVVKVTAEEDYKEAQKEEDKFTVKQKYFEKPLLIPVAADAITYEALVLEMARSLRRINFPEWCEKTNKYNMGMYLHSSLCFCLEEISSLFRKRMEDLVNCLIKVYDCQDYNYETIKRGKDRVKSCCLNFFGGTTPGFMQSVFNDKLLSEGFSSRTFFIYATKNRKTALRIPELTKEQLDYKKEILDHVGKLTKLYGPVEVTEEAWQFLEDWWVKAQSERPNTSNKLNPYYARKNIHVQKLAMALHFGESTEMKIGIARFQEALVVLADEEKKMHYALGFDSDNPLQKVTTKLENYLIKSEKAKTYKELYAEFWSQIPTKSPGEDLNVILQHLVFMGSIAEEMKEHPHSKQFLKYYAAKKESEI